MSAKSRQRAVQEMQTLLNLTHPNVVRYHRAFLYEGQLCYMTEFADCGTLHHLVYTAKERGQRLPDALVWHIFMQICHGLKKLHSSGVCHRALKTRNLLLFPEQLFAHPYLKYRCKLTDLGIPELQKRVRLGELDGSTLRYVAPEVLSGQQLGDEKADVWSLGCVLYEMATLSHAFNATSAIQRGEYTPLPDHVSPEVREVLESIFVLDPTRRPTVDELLLVPTVASCVVEMPNPVLLDGSLAPAAASTSTDAARQAGATPGTMVWAKQAGDGMWHRGVVHSSVDADSCFVHFVERRTVELVWHDGLRVVPPSPSTLSTQPSRASSSSSSVIPGFSRDDTRDSGRDAASARDLLRDLPRRVPSMVRWSEELSSQGDVAELREEHRGSTETGRGSLTHSLTSTMERSSLPVSSLGSAVVSQRQSLSDPPWSEGLNSHPPHALALEQDRPLAVVSPNTSEKQMALQPAAPKASRACVIL